MLRHRTRRVRRRAVPPAADHTRHGAASFYTPREIVDYMVDESLLAYLETALGQGAGKKFNFSEKLNFWLLSLCWPFWPCLFQSVS